MPLELREEKRERLPAKVDKDNLKYLESIADPGYKLIVLFLEYDNKVRGYTIDELRNDTGSSVSVNTRTNDCELTHNDFTSSNHVDIKVNSPLGQLEYYSIGYNGSDTYTITKNRSTINFTNEKVESSDIRIPDTIIEIKIKE